MIVTSGSSAGRLFYDVACQAAEPAKKEGRIWVKSSVPMTHFEFSPIWGGVGIGAVAIQGNIGGANPLPTNNVLEVFQTKRKGIPHRMKASPASCMQVQGTAGNWVNVDAYVCHGGTWVQFSSTKYVVFEAGKGLSAGLTGFSNATYNSDKIVAKNPLDAGHGNGDSVISKEKIDVTQYKTATFSGINCGFSGNGNANSSNISAFVGGASTNIGSTTTSGSATLASNKTITVDISNVTGPVEFGFKTYSSAAYAVSFKNFNLNGIVFS